MHTRTLAALLSVVLATACTEAEGPTRVRLSEVGSDSGFRFRHELPGRRLDSLAKAAMGGFALIDHDGDGDADIYMVNGGWHPEYGRSAEPPEIAKNRLFRNDGDFRFTDVTETAGVGDTGFGMGAVAADYDGDGDQDLFVCNFGGSVLYRNEGGGRFTDVTEQAGIPSGFHMAATFLDYDRDGILDLFVAQYIDPDGVAQGMRVHTDSRRVLPPGAYRPQPDLLLRGTEDGRFEDVTSKAGLDRPGRGMSVVATDFDDDGWIDLLVANDGMENFAWRNRGDGTFTDAAAAIGLAFGLNGRGRASMGITAADLDGDGGIDYLVPDSQGGMAYAKRDDFFRDRSESWGLSQHALGSIGWADVALDADLDGRVDVYKTHGGFNDLLEQRSRLLMNLGAGKFQAASGGTGMVDAVARGGVSADFDLDGRPDLLLLALEGEARLLRNRSTGVGNWVRLRLVGAGRNTYALGARVEVTAGGRVHVQELSASTGYASGGEQTLHFGLGAEDGIETVRVRWPSGAESTFGPFDAGETHELRETR